jgi:NADPH:quinone reductase-like Zn-dependent oxidoreductase
MSVDVSVPCSVGARSSTTACCSREIAGRVFAALREGVLRVDVRHRYPLAAAAYAHRDLEARRVTGPLTLLPWRRTALW